MQAKITAALYWHIDEDADLRRELASGVMDVLTKADLLLAMGEAFAPAYLQELEQAYSAWRDISGLHKRAS